MNEILLRQPAAMELHRIILRLDLVSHVSAAAPGKSTPSSDEDIGGKRPSGGIDYRGDREDNYRQKSAVYFRRRWERAQTLSALEALLKEAQDALEAWQRTPLPSGQEPQPGDPQWKRYIAESTEDAGVLARRFWNPATGKEYTRRYINMIRQQYRK